LSQDLKANTDRADGLQKEKDRVQADLARTEIEVAKQTEINEKARGDILKLTQEKDQQKVDMQKAIEELKSKASSMGTS